MVGGNAWPFPLPIVKHGNAWSFDAAAGRQELLYRRIGANELDAIEICHGFVEAQHEYALEKHDGSLSISTPSASSVATGKQDGLAWQKP